jgi:thiol-disulfide isomerase/thioredoxin
MRLVRFAVLLIACATIGAMSHKAAAAERIVFEPPTDEMKAAHAKALREAVLLSPDGTPYDMRASHAKVIWFNQWAHWCAPCIAEFSTMKKLQDEVGRDRLEIVLLSLPKDWDKDRAYAAAHNIDFPLYLLPKSDLETDAALRLGKIMEQNERQVVRASIPLSTLIAPAEGTVFVHRGSQLDPEKIEASWKRIHLRDFIDEALAH